MLERVCGKKHCFKTKADAPGGNVSELPIVPWPAGILSTPEKAAQSIQHSIVTIIRRKARDHLVHMIRLAYLPPSS
jgi:hypothetical protein